MKRIVSLLLTTAGLLLMVSCQGTSSTPKSEKVASSAIPQDTAKAVGQVTEVSSAADKSAVVPQTEKIADPEKAEQKAPLGAAPKQERGLAAIANAGITDKYLFIFFYTSNDNQTEKMRKVFDAAAQKVASRTEAIVINATDSAEKGIVAKFNVNRAPMPLALVLAPNGAITGGFPIKFEENQLTSALVSQGLAKSLKALQEGKLVLLCVQSGKTKSNDAAMQGVNAFKTDTRFAKSTEVVTIDPTDDQELKFLTQVRIDPKTSEAVTALMVPPGSVVAKYNGATDKDVMIAALAALKAGGGGG
jgi:hypothetical protein